MPTSGGKKVTTGCFSIPGSSYTGRLRRVALILGDRGGSLSVGSKETMMAELNCDLDRAHSPQIAASALHLPFIEGIFQTILFTDVIEHIPRGTEPQALKEIRRCLKKEGRLILSTPNDILVFKLLDPAWWLVKHRHYQTEKIAGLLESAGFETRRSFCSGGVFQIAELFVHYFIGLPIHRICGVLPRSISWLKRKVDGEYDLASPKGYTLFVEAFASPNEK